MQPPDTWYRRTGKRWLDVVLASLGLVVLSPVILALALVVRWRVGRPVWFRQERPGLLGRPFILIKFRSMSNATDAQGALRDDADRLTPFGRWMRSASLDELPELVNVLRGEMSLVGPRPLLMAYLPRYNARQRRRHDVLPGITGWAQLNGRNAISWDEKFEHDIWYVEHLSFPLDLKILLRTLWAIARRDGINRPGHATAPEFRPGLDPSGGKVAGKTS